LPDAVVNGAVMAEVIMGSSLGNVVGERTNALD
jgi:hypothetical protein